MPQADRWEQDFDVYFTLIDDAPASVVVDLAAGAHAPVASHPVRLTTRVPMRIAREDGLRDAAELDALSDLEDRFVDALADKVDAIYVGRTVHAGDTTLFLYVPEAYRDALDELPTLTGSPGDYDPEWWVEDDPAWDLYQELLAPGPYEAQQIWNRRLVAIFRDQGDALETPREIDHVAMFPSRERAEQAAAAPPDAGFRVDDLDEPETSDAGDDADHGSEDGASWSVSFHRDDHLADGRPDEFVGEILDVILDLDGTYDGWGAEHRPRAQGSA